MKILLKSFFYFILIFIFEAENRNTKVMNKNLFTGPEPWEKWETKLVIYSILTGIALLIILGVIINSTILS